MAVSAEMMRFKADMEADESLRAKYEEAIERIVEAKDATSDGDAMCKAAAELGYQISVAELERARADSLEDVDEEELDEVAGGLCWEDYACDFAYHTKQEKMDLPKWCMEIYSCLTVLMHADTGEDSACFSKYKCAPVFRHPDGF